MSLKPRTEVLTFSGTAAAVKQLLRSPYAGKIVAVRGYRVAGTGAVVKALKNGVTVMSADKSLTSADTWMAGSLSATASVLRVAAGDTIGAEIVSVAGAPTDVVIQIEISRDADSHTNA